MNNFKAILKAATLQCSVLLFGRGRPFAATGQSDRRADHRDAARRHSGPDVGLQLRRCGWLDRDLRSVESDAHGGGPQS